MAQDIFKIDLDGFVAELPILPLPSGIKIGFFNLHGDSARKLQRGRRNGRRSHRQTPRGSKENGGHQRWG